MCVWKWVVLTSVGNVTRARLPDKQKHASPTSVYSGKGPGVSTPQARGLPVTHKSPTVWLLYLHCNQKHELNCSKWPHKTISESSSWPGWLMSNLQYWLALSGGKTQRLSIERWHHRTQCTSFLVVELWGDVKKWLYYTPVHDRFKRSWSHNSISCNFTLAVFHFL